MFKTSYTLIIPGLFASAQQVQQTQAQQLKKWLRSAQTYTTTLSYADYLLACFDYPKAVYDWATLRAKEDGLDPKALWLCADPLHVAVDVTHIYALGNAYLELSSDEVDAYVHAINAYLPASLQLVAPHPMRWYLKLDRHWNITCSTPYEIFAKTIRDKMPEGVDGGQARALFNEIQMVLHAHPSNLARQQSGKPTLDALWLWGAGEALLPRGFNAFDCVQTNDPLASALARQHQIPVVDLRDRVYGNILFVDTRFQFQDSLEVAYHSIPETLYPFLAKVYVGNGVVYEKSNWWKRLCNVHA